MGVLMKRVILLTCAALLLAGCAEWEHITPDASQLTRIAVEFPEGPTKEAVQATAVARFIAAEEARLALEDAKLAEQNASAERRQAAAEHQRVVIAMTAEAQAVVEARENEALATRQSINSAATAQAVAVDGTRQAQNLSAEATAQSVRVQATATAEARNAEATSTAQVQNERATATAASATATMVAAMQAVEATAQHSQSVALDATSQAVRRETDRQNMTQPLLTFGPWLLALAGLVAVVYIGIKAWTLFEDRARLVRRRADEGEPMMIINRERMALPLRQFGPYVDMTHGSEHAPLLAPTIEAQEGTTTRQQAANVIHAQQAGQIAEAKSKREPERHVTVVMPEKARQVSKGRRKTEAGLLGPLTDDAIPPKLLEAITAQWEIVEDD